MEAHRNGVRRAAIEVWVSVVARKRGLEGQSEQPDRRPNSVYPFDMRHAVNWSCNALAG